MEKAKLNVKDLINIGLFTAIYFIVFFAVGMTGYIPFMMLLLPFLISLAGGIPIMLFITKVPKFGALSIMGTIVSVLMLLTGHPWPIVAIGVPVSILGDYIISKGHYKNWLSITTGYTFFCQWTLGAMYPFYFMREAYLKTIQSGYGSEYVDAIDALFSPAMIPVIIIGSVVGAILGAYIGRATLKKHFKRAGIV